MIEQFRDFYFATHFATVTIIADNGMEGRQNQVVEMKFEKGGKDFLTKAVIGCEK